jgi:hypothetical protein
MPVLEFLGMRCNLNIINALKGLGTYAGGLACQVVFELRSLSFVPSADLSMG